MLGFDFGSNEMKIAQWDGKTVKRLVSAPMPDNMVKEGQIVSYEALADLIKSTMKKQRISGKECAFILPDRQVFIRRVNMPAMTEEQLAVNLPYEFRDFLTKDKSKYFYAHSLNSMTNDEDGKPKEMDLLAAAVEKDVIQEYRYMFQRAGLKPTVALPRVCAYSNLILLKGEAAESEYCFIDLGHSATRLDIFTGAAFETSRVMDTGLSSVDRVLAEALDVDEHVANLYKRGNHDAVQERAEALAIFNTIAVELRRAVNFYAFNNSKSDLKKLWFCGGGAYIPALTSAICQTAELETADIMQILPNISGNGEQAAVFTAAIGAAVQTSVK